MRTVGGIGAPEGSTVGERIASPDFTDNLALWANSMRMNPDPYTPNLIYQRGAERNRVAAEDRLTAREEDKRNKTYEVMKQYYPEAAELMRNGMIDPNTAISITRDSNKERIAQEAAAALATGDLDKAWSLAGSLAPGALGQSIAQMKQAEAEAARTSTTNNRTADYLESIGATDEAAMVRNGGMSGKDALARLDARLKEDNKISVHKPGDVIYRGDEMVGTVPGARPTTAPGAAGQMQGFYDYATNVLKMPPDEAAKYAEEQTLQFNSSKAQLSTDTEYYTDPATGERKVRVVPGSLTEQKMRKQDLEIQKLEGNVAAAAQKIEDEKKRIANGEDVRQVYHDAAITAADQAIKILEGQGDWGGALDPGGPLAGNLAKYPLTQPLVPKATALSEGAISTLKGAIAIERLEKMREISKNGASGFGNLTEVEFTALQNSLGSLSTVQGPQLLENLKNIRETMLKIYQNPAARAAWEATASSTSSDTGDEAAAPTTVQVGDDEYTLE